MLNDKQKLNTINDTLIVLGTILLYLYLGYKSYSLIYEAFGLPMLTYVQTTAGMVLVGLVGRLLHPPNTR